MHNEYIQNNLNLHSSEVPRVNFSKEKFRQ